MRSFLLWLALCGIACATEWTVRNIDGRNYVGSRDLAVFYGLPTETRTGNTLKLGSGRKTLLLTLGSRQVEINGVNHWLAFPIIERDGSFWVSRLDLGKTIEPALRPELIQDLQPFTTVVLDAGHGGPDKGAIGPFEVEKNFTLDMARRVRNELQAAGVRVFLTRNTDTFIELADRASIANSRQNAIFVSLHFNAGTGNSAANGFEIFCVTPRGSPSTEYDELLVRDMIQEYGNDYEVPSFLLANSIYHAMHGKLDMFDRGVKRARFAVLRLTRMPAVLIEGGFLSNPADARRIADPIWRQQLARAISTGILEYRQLIDMKRPPRIAGDYRSGVQIAAATPSPSPTPLPSVSLRPLPEPPSGQPSPSP